MTRDRCDDRAFINVGAKASYRHSRVFNIGVLSDRQAGCVNFCLCQGLTRGVQRGGRDGHAQNRHIELLFGDHVFLSQLFTPFGFVSGQCMGGFMLRDLCLATFDFLL